MAECSISLFEAKIDELVHINQLTLASPAIPILAKMWTRLNHSIHTSPTVKNASCERGDMAKVGAIGLTLARPYSSPNFPSEYC